MNIWFKVQTALRRWWRWCCRRRRKQVSAVSSILSLTNDERITCCTVALVVECGRNIEHGSETNLKWKKNRNGYSDSIYQESISILFKSIKKTTPFLKPFLTHRLILYAFLHVMFILPMDTFENTQVNNI